MSGRRDMSVRGPLRLLPLGIIAAGVLAYANSFGGRFIFDDTPMIVNRPGIDAILPLRWGTRSVADLTFKLNYAAGGLNVADYHAVNLLIHILAGLLLYGVVRRTLLSPAMARRCAGAAGSLAAVVAVLWVVHPLQTESVTYICQRYESLMGMFYLLCLYAWIRAREVHGCVEKEGADPGERSAVCGSRAAVGWYMVAAVAFVLGMGTKEVMITAPVIIFLYDCVFGSGAAVAAMRRHVWIPVVLLAALICVAVPCFRLMLLVTGQGNDLLARITPIDYLMTQPGVILHYIRLAVVPYPLCLDYGWPIARGVMSVPAPGLVVLSMVVGTVWCLCRRHPAGFAGAWFFVILAPTSSVMPFEDMAFEHRMYLPLAAVIAFMVVSAYRLLKRVERARGMTPRAAATGGAVVAVVPVLAFLVLTVMRNGVYASEHGMWLDVVSKRPNNVRAGFGLIGSLLARGDLVEAERLAVALVQRIESGDPAIADTRIRALSGGYYYPMVLNKLGQIIAAAGRPDEAIEHYRKSLAVRADDTSTYCNLAVALHLTGRTDDAIANCRAAIEIDPGYGRGHAFLGLLLAGRGEYAAAVRHYSVALEADPNMLTVRYDLAWLLATCPDAGVRDGRKALALAMSVDAATGHGSHEAADLLAAALAECGRFGEAAAAARRALDLARGSAAVARGAAGAGHGVTVDAIEGRLRLYEDGKAFRSERTGG